MAASAAKTSSRATVMNAVNAVRSAVQDVFAPMLPDVTREAAAGLERDEAADAGIKRSAQRLQYDQAGFAARFVEAIDREIDSALEEFLTQSAKPEQEASSGGLSLVEYGQMEQDMMLDRISSRLRNACDDEFSPLNQRLTSLSHQGKATDRENPFHPMRFCQALRQALQQSGFKGDDQLMMIKAFDAPLTRPLEAMYAEMNSRLDSQGIKESGTSLAFRNTVMGLRRNTVSGAVKSAGEAEHTGAKAEQLLQTLYQRMQLVAGGAGNATSPGAAPGAPSGTSSTDFHAPAGGMHGAYDQGQHPQGGASPQEMAAMFQAAMATVAAGQGGSSSTDFNAEQTRGAPAGGISAFPQAAASGGPVQFTAIDPGLLTSINDIQRLGMMSLMAAAGGGRSSGLSADDERNVRSKLAERATKQVDKLTIELVGMLFDRIHQDKHVPNEIKIVLSRLQFPVLKVALTDPDLFVSPIQPARRLMDRIASTSVGWTPSGEENKRYLAEVNKVVNAVAFAINDGPEIFVTALEGFEKYLNEERIRDDNPVLRAKRALEEAETREIMAINATIGVRKAFEGVQLESYLRDFLLDTWIKVLVAATLVERDGPELVAKYRALVPDLVWSVQPKINVEDRKRLVKTIPSVLTGLREGLELIKLPTAQAQDFFGKLMASHAQAVKALETAYAAPGAVDAEQLKQRLDAVKIETPGPQEAGSPPVALSRAVLAQSVAANHAEVDLLEADSAMQEEGSVLEDLSDAELDRIIGSWQRGAWFDLWTRDGTERVRLQWVSPRKTFYLFASTDSAKVYSLPPEALRSYVRNDRLQPIESAPLFDRAVGEMMRDLSGKETDTKTESAV